VAEGVFLFLLGNSNKHQKPLIIALLASWTVTWVADIALIHFKFRYPKIALIVICLAVVVFLMPYGLMVK
jgi:hypothetical protein